MYIPLGFSLMMCYIWTSAVSWLLFILYKNELESCEIEKECTCTDVVFILLYILLTLVPQVLPLRVCLLGFCCFPNWTRFLDSPWCGLSNLCSCANDFYLSKSLSRPVCGLCLWFACRVMCDSFGKGQMHISSLKFHIHPRLQSCHTHVVSE